MSLKRKEIFEFGDFRLDVDERTLERIDGREGGKLPDKAFAVLVELVRQSGHLVSKNDLIEAVWPDTIVEENNLDKSIHQIRQILGDRGDHGERYIETVRKHGYRFIGHVRVTEVSGSWIPVIYRHDDLLSDETAGAVEVEDPISLPSPPRPTTEPIGETTQRRSFVTRYRTLLVIGILAGTAAALGFFNFSNTPRVISEGRSIAVLPLKPIDRSNRDELLEVGIVESIIDRIGRASNLVVRPMNAVRTYAYKDQDPIIAGQEQKVSYVLASEYQLVDGKIRIISQLINVATGVTEETFNVEAPASGVFAVQKTAAAELATKIVSRFGGTRRERSTARTGTESEEAYRFYLHGMGLFKRAGRENLVGSVESFKQAVAIDPNYAQAWAGLALAYFARSTALRASDGTEYKGSMDAIARALSIDPNVSEAYSAFCANKFRHEHDFAGAEAFCKRALELDPSSADAHNIYSVFLSTTGRHDEAIAEIKQAVDLEPASFFFQRWFANSLYLARRYDEAIERYKKNIELDPQHEPTYYWMTKALQAQGREAEAFEYFIRSLQIVSPNTAAVERYNGIFRSSGWRGVLRARAMSKESPNVFRIALWYATLGEKDKAFDRLEKAYQTNEWTILLLRVEPHFDSLRDDPRYTDLTKRLIRDQSNSTELED